MGFTVQSVVCKLQEMGFRVEELELKIFRAWSDLILPKLLDEIPRPARPGVLSRVQRMGFTVQRVVCKLQQMGLRV
jgi:hypothetical protein